MIIRAGNIDDLAELQQLFVNAVTGVCAKDYNREQIRAWVSGIENKPRWLKVLTHQFVVIAQDHEKITGFATLESGNYLDLLFVHKDYQRQGIAHQLYVEIEKEVLRQSQKELTAEVSKTARKFFEEMGFSVIKEQTVNVKGVELTNYKMAKRMELSLLGESKGIRSGSSDPK